MLDMLCLTGEIGWARLSAPDAAARPRVVGATPVALFLREHGELWRALREGETLEDGGALRALSDAAREVHRTLDARGASFLRDLSACATDRDALLGAVGELVSAGLVTSDGFDGLRTIVGSAARGRQGAAHAGRWVLLGRANAACDRGTAVDAQAWALLRRYGVVFRRLLSREANAAPWRDLVRVYRRLEARGEIRGGRFVSGLSGEQFAMAAAIGQLRDTRRTPPDDHVITISAADPLNLAGIVTDGERVKAVAASRVTYQNGVLVTRSVTDGQSASRRAGFAAFQSAR